MTLTAPTASVALPSNAEIPALKALPALNAGISRPGAVMQADPEKANSESSTRRGKPLLAGLRAVSEIGIGAPAAVAQALGRLFHGESEKTGTVEPEFDGAPAAAKTAAVEVRPHLPSFLKSGDPEDAEFLAQVVEEAMKSGTGASVLKRIEELSGGGRRPTLIELFEYKDGNEGEVTFDWELVRLDKKLMERGPANAAPSFIHELTHVLQIAEGLPYGALELEIEAYLHSLKVAHELGLTFKRGHFLELASRKFRHSLNSFIDFVAESYDDSFTLLNGSFEDMEKRLLKEKRQGDRNIAEYEATLADRQASYKELKAAEHPERFLKSYYTSEIKANRTNIASEEASLYWALRDLKILNTEAGRQRYLKFSRRVLKAARRFQRRVRYKNSPKKATRVSLPTVAQLKAFEFAPMEKKKLKHQAGKPTELPGTPEELPPGVRVLPKEDAPWVGAVLRELKKSAVGVELLEALAKRAAERGRAFVLDVSHTGRENSTEYNWDFDLIQVADRYRRIPLAEAAANLAGALHSALNAHRAPSYGLELELDGWAAALMVAKELGVKIKRGSALYWVERQFRRPDLRKFLSWAQKYHDKLVLFRGLVGTQSKARLEHRRELTLKARQRHRDYLKARRATYKMMRASHHPRWALEAYRADEIGQTENEVIESEETLAWIESDLELLKQPKLVEAYRNYAAEVMDRIGRYHIAYLAKDPS